MATPELLRRNEAAELLSVSVATFEILRRTDDHPLPPPICVGPRKGHRWRRAALLEWIDARERFAQAGLS